MSLLEALVGSHIPLSQKHKLYDLAICAAVRGFLCLKKSLSCGSFPYFCIFSTVLVPIGT